MTPAAGTNFVRKNSDSIANITGGIQWEKHARDWNY
jgi:hypothetical protein